MNYQEKAKQIVIDYYNEHVEITDTKKLKESEVFIVWFSKTLQNWKALISTTISDGMYYEVTYNGDKKKHILMHIKVGKCLYKKCGGLIMWKIRKGLILSAVLLSVWLSPLFCGSHAQAEAQYTISETDLTTLETSLNQLKIDSEKKDKLLIQQQTQLNEAQKQLKIVNEQLKKSKVLNEATENSLKIARESFNEYEKRGGTENQN